MDSTSLLALVTSLCTAGGIGYLVVEKLFTRKKDNAETNTTVISNSNEIAELYKKIDEIVESKVAPIQEKLDEIESNWCCYREGCEMRILSSFYKDHHHEA